MWHWNIFTIWIRLIFIPFFSREIVNKAILGLSAGILTTPTLHLLHLIHIFKVFFIMGWLRYVMNKNEVLYCGEHPFDDKYLHQIYSFMKISIAFPCGVYRKNYDYCIRKTITIFMHCKEWAVIQILLKYRSELLSLWKSIILSLEAFKKVQTLYFKISIQKWMDYFKLTRMIML